MSMKQFCSKYRIHRSWILKAVTWGLLKPGKELSPDLRFVNIPQTMQKEPEIVLIQSIPTLTRQERLNKRGFIRASSEGKRRVAERILALRREIEETRQRLVALVLTEHSASKAYWNLLWETPDCPWCHGKGKSESGRKCVWCRKVEPVIEQGEEPPS